MNFLRKNILSIALVSLVIFVSIGGFVFAQGLVPCGPGTGKDCDTCQLFELLNNIINFITLQIVPVLAVAMIMVGAFFLITAGGSETAIKKGHDIITAAIIGSLIILSAWLIIDVVLKNLAPGDTAKPWYDIKCEAPTQPPISENVPAVGTPNIPPLTTSTETSKQYYSKHPELKDKDESGSNWTMTEKAQLYTHDEALQKLKDQGINVYGSGGLCADQNRSGCTSLNGMPQKEVDRLVEINKNCSNCGTMVVTGGTEAGHQSQGFGRASMDLGYSENLYNNLKTQSGVTAVREKQFNGNGTCDAGWECYSHVTGQHISFYVDGANLYK